MKSRLAWFVAGLGVASAAAARAFRRPQAARLPAAPPVPEPPPEPDERADELRRRIEEAKPLVEEREEFEAAETPVDEADPDERRRAIHSQGREAVERMRGGDDTGA